MKGVVYIVIKIENYEITCKCGFPHFLLIGTYAYNICYTKILPSMLD